MLDRKIKKAAICLSMSFMLAAAWRRMTAIRQRLSIFLRSTWLTLPSVHWKTRRTRKKVRAIIFPSRCRAGQEQLGIRL